MMCDTHCSPSSCPLVNTSVSKEEETTPGLHLNSFPRVKIHNPWLFPLPSQVTLLLSGSISLSSFWPISPQDYAQVNPHWYHYVPNKAPSFVYPGWIKLGQTVALLHGGDEQFRRKKCSWIHFGWEMKRYWWCWRGESSKLDGAKLNKQVETLVMEMLKGLFTWQPF